MLLTIDIGNSHITLGVFKEQELCLTSRIHTDHQRTEDQYAVEIHDIMALYDIRPDDVTDAILCSVVPGLTQIIFSAIEKSMRIKPLILGPGVRTGLNIQVDNPAELGADLVAGAVGALAKYPVPCIMYDLGTATTIFVLNEKGAIIGGSICAGAAITLDALSSRTALLPHVGIQKPASPIGRNTINCMQAGLVYGMAAMMDGMAERMEKELGATATLVVTGGLAHCIVPACSRKYEVDDNLILDGLRLIYEKNRKTAR